MISIIIPTYKTKGGLLKSIDSVLNQTYQDFEIIVVDDNDPFSEFREFTEKIMEKYEGNEKVLYLKHEKNKNGAAARNTGINASHGEYIAFLDDDDEYLPEKLEKQVAYLDSHPEKDAVYTRIIVGNRVINAYPYEGNALIPLLKERTRMFTSCLMFRRDALLSFGGFNESFRRHQDYDLMINFFLHGYTIGLIREPLISYCTTGGNRVSGMKLEELKHQYLRQFDFVLNDLELKHPGIKSDIIANNFASVFISHIMGKRIGMATKVFLKYGFTSVGFISFVLNFIKNHIYTYK